MTIYHFNGKHSELVVSPHRSTVETPKLAVGDYFMPENTSGSAVDQLEAVHHGSEQPYPGVLVVLVGHFADKLKRLINLYNSSADLHTHKSFVAFNGDKDQFDELVRPNLPGNIICDPVLLDNVGWDLRMYASGVLRFAFENYFMINDDTNCIESGWLEEYEEKIKRVGAVGIQGVGHIRTTYYGMKRKLWLAIYVAVTSGLVQYNLRSLPKWMRRKIIKNTAVDAYNFEGCNMWLCEKLGMKHDFMDDRFVMKDALCRTPRQCGRLARPGTRFIKDIEGGLHQKLTIDYIINLARSKRCEESH